MPAWKKVITSGSDASLKSLNVTNGVTGSLFGTASFAVSASYAPSGIGTAIVDNTDNYVLTATGGSTIQGESNLTFDGGTLNVNANLIQGSTANSTPGGGAHAEGYSTQAIGSFAHTEGVSTVAIGEYSHAEGYSTSTGTEHAFYSDNIASGVITIDSGYGDLTLIFVAGNPLIFSDVPYDNIYGITTFIIDSVTWDGTKTIITLTDTSVNTDRALCGDVKNFTNWSGNGGDQIIAPLYAHSEGESTNAFNNSSHAEGASTVASGTNSHAEGYQTTAGGTNSHAEGRGTLSLGGGTHAEGYITVASGDYSHAEGSSTIAQGTYSHAEGSATSASGDYSHAEGRATIALGNYSHAEGRDSQAQGSYSHAEGNSISIGAYSHAEGGGISYGGYSHAEGNGAIASGSFSHAEGEGTLAVGLGSHAEGFYTITSGDYQHAQGQYNIASSAQSAFIIGNGTGVTRSNLVFASGSTFQITGSLLVSSGSSTELTVTGTGVTLGNIITDTHRVTGSLNISGSVQITGSLGITGSISQGSGSIATGLFSHAQGDNTLASGRYSHTEGLYTTASGNYSHAEGWLSLASGSYSHAEGKASIAYGESSHAEGSSTLASGAFSHAEGLSTTTIGQYSHAEGFGTITKGDYQHVQGQYNISSSAQSAFIIGNGTSTSARSNLVFASGSQFQVTGSVIATQGITGSLFGTSSWATNVVNNGVTSVDTAGTVSGITLTGGTITGAGTITLGGSISGLTNSNLSGTAGITNANLANSSVTVGSTAISLGSSATTIAGLSSVTSTTFVGALTGNATTANTASWATNLSGGSVVATGIYGTTLNIAGNGATADPYGTIAITQPANTSNYSYYGLTRAGNLGAGFGITGTTGALGLGANAYWFGTATAGLAGTMGTAWLAFNGSSLVAVGTISGTSFSGAGTGLTGITNSNLSGTAGITNANLANSAITIAGTSTSLGGSISQATILAGSGVFSGSAQISGLTNSNLSGTAGITNANLANSSVTVGSTAISLGSSATTIAGLSSVTSTTFVGALTGNASTATSATSATSATTATNATNIAITDTTTTAGTYYPVFVSATTGNVPARTDSSTFTYNPNTNTLTVGTVSGALTGNASTATQTTATVTGTNSADLVYGNMADNDQFRIRIGGTGTNAGFVEIATADDGTEPIHVRQYTGVFSSLARTATLLDGSGNTSFPGTVTATGFTGALTGNASTATSATTATNATNIAITNNTSTNAAYYPVFVSTTTGNLAATVDSTGLTYNPFTNTITATASYATNALTASTAVSTPNAFTLGGSPFVGYVPYANGNLTLTNTSMYYSGTSLGINTATPETELHIEDVTKVLTGNVSGVAQGTLSLAVTDAQAANIGPSLVFGGRYVDGSQTRIAYAGIAGRKDNSTSVNADGYLSFLTWRSTGLTEAMRITPAGRLGIATTSPGHALDVNGVINAVTDVRAPIFYDSDNTAYNVNPAATTNLWICNAQSSISAPIFYNVGSTTYYVNPGSLSRLYSLDMVGAISSQSTVTATSFVEAANSAYYFDGGNTGDSIRTAGNIVAYYSDERLKDKKGNIENALEKLLTLNGFYYEPNERAQELGYKKKLEIGVSAQEVEAVLPEIVNDAPIGYGYKTLDYSKLVPLLIEAIKEQQKQIDELKSIK